MDLQVLVSTMHQNDHSIVEKMNIQTEAIIINQCDRNKFEEFEYLGRNIKFFSLKERGASLSRNTALMRATSDISLFADDDVTYENNYEKIITESFKNIPDADVIVFNVVSTNLNRSEYIIKEEKRVRFYNCLRYGTFRIAVRTESIRKVNISFSLLFGGGAKYGSGEDSIFIMDCIKKGLNIYAVPLNIGIVTHNESTWFKGYTDKFFIDKGALFYSISKRWAHLLCLQYLIRHNETYNGNKTLLETYRLMNKGIQQLK